MVEQIITLRRNVIDFARYQRDREAGRAQAISPKLCRHCGAAMLDGENEDDCSSAFNALASQPRAEAPRRFYAE